MSNQDFEIQADLYDNVFVFKPKGHDNVVMTITLPTDPKDGEAFDFLAAKASAVIIAALEHMVEEAEELELSEI